MYDVFDDEIDEMYDQMGKVDSQLAKGISLRDPLGSLTQSKFIVLNEAATLHNAINNIQKESIGCVLLENNHKLTGIFTERDIVQKIVGNRHNLNNENIAKYMTKYPECLHLSDPIAYALNKMITGGFRHIPIVDKKEKPIGVISMQDIINHLGDYFFDHIVNLPPIPSRKLDYQQRRNNQIYIKHYLAETASHQWLY